MIGTEPMGPTETPRERVLPVVAKLQEFKHDQVKPLLDAALAAKHEVDPKAGIAIVDLEGEIETPDGKYHFHGARILTNGSVKSHFHNQGEEPYNPLSGSGEMNTGRVVDGQVVWDEPRIVSAGETIIVKEGQVHSLRNPGGNQEENSDDRPLDFTFACPDSHLQDPPTPGADRFFTADLPNGTPPHYPTAA